MVRVVVFRMSPNPVIVRVVVAVTLDSPVIVLLVLAVTREIPVIVAFITFPIRASPNIVWVDRKNLRTKMSGLNGCALPNRAIVSNN